MNTVACVLLFISLASAAEPGGMRNWTDRLGRVVTAKFVRVFDDKVVLQRGQKVFTVPLAELSNDDVTYLRGLIDGEANAPPGGAEEGQADGAAPQGKMPEKAGIAEGLLNPRPTKPPDASPFVPVEPNTTEMHEADPFEAPAEMPPAPSRSTRILSRNPLRSQRPRCRPRPQRTRRRS
ncbi:MAG: SHD1 domain-containing protein, partial [Planctomycetota bacterium]